MRLNLRPEKVILKEHHENFNLIRTVETKLLTNQDRWAYYMKDCQSPQIFLDWGYYSLIASALQRKVWTGDIRKPLFPNLYVILCGAPGIGKGLVISEIAKILRYHKLGAPTESGTNTIDMGNFREQTKRKGKQIDLTKEQYLIPIGPDATTYQRLVEIMAKSCRVLYKAKPGETAKDIYRHSSLTICLEELSSMFRKHMEDLVNFLLVAYDCGDYRYESISRDEDQINSCCLNMLGGTTPTFIKRVFGDELLTDGFSSRTVFAHALSNRFMRLRPPIFEQHQIDEYERLLVHVKDLANLYGPVKFTDEAEKFLEYWWCNEHPVKRANNSPKLIAYYARKNIHVQKLAMILNFSDSLNMEVGIEHCKKALAILEATEKQMHFAVTLDNKNPLNGVAHEIYNFLLKEGPKLRKELLLVFYGELPKGEDDLKACISFLMQAGKIVVDGMMLKANVDKVEE